MKMGSRRRPGIDEREIIVNDFLEKREGKTTKLKWRDLPLDLILPPLLLLDLILPLPLLHPLPLPLLTPLPLLVLPLPQSVQGRAGFVSTGGAGHQGRGGEGAVERGRWQGLLVGHAFVEYWRDVGSGYN